MKAEIGQAIEGFLLRHFDKVDLRNSDKSMYMRRFFLIGGKGGSSIKDDKIKNDKAKLMLHIFYSGDEGNCLHDHPWDFTSYIIAGGYFEKTMQDKGVADIDSYIKGLGFKAKQIPWTEWKRPGSILRHKAEHRHQVKLGTKIVRKSYHVEGIGQVLGYAIEKKRCWTLVWRSKKKRDWGFWNKGVFTHFSKWKNTMCGE